MLVLSVLYVPGLGSSVLRFLMRSFCIWSVSDTFIVPWCLLKQMQHDIWLFMWKWVGFRSLCFFSILTHKGNLYIIVVAIPSIYFHNELCGSECNFLHVCEQGRYCFVWHQTPLRSDVFMLKELTNNVDSIRPHNLRGSLGNTRLLY